MHKFQDYEIELIYSQYENKVISEAVFHDAPEYLAKSINLFRFIRIRMHELNIATHEFRQDSLEFFLLKLGFNFRAIVHLMQSINFAMSDINFFSIQTFECIEMVLIKSYLVQQMKA